MKNQQQEPAEGRIGPGEWAAALVGLVAVLAGAALILGAAYWMMVR